MSSRNVLIVAVVGVFSSATQADVITIHELLSDFSWGYRCGVKQPLGAHKNGLSVHQITKSNYPGERRPRRSGHP